MENMEDEVIVEEFEEKTSTNKKNEYLQEVKEVKLENSEKKYSKVAYCILAFFLGVFGIHLFYAKKTMQGIIFVVFAIIGIITAAFYIGVFIIMILRITSFVQMLIALFKKSDEFGRIS